MSALESLGMNANQWQFLKDAKKYVEASKNSGRELRLESTERQFLTTRDILARLNGSVSQGVKARRGVLLADDVGLGKTTIAALVAWVTACAGGERKVRILAPNEVMKQRWADELHLHVQPLQECAPHLDVRPSRIKPHKGKLHPGRIQIATHYHAAESGKIDPCELLIVDEAHRAKGESSRFADALKKLHARRILILTATPFSIDVENELLRMLRLIGAEGVKGPVREYKKALDRLYQGDVPSNPEEEADRLARKAKAAVDALQPYLIRHSVADLKRELQWFGEEEPWKIDVPTATAQELELILRLDRVLRVKDKDGSRSSNATNDARFHVGWQYHKEQREHLNDRLPQFAEPARGVVKHHLQAMKQSRKTVGTHSKIRAVADAAKAKVADGEKVVVFCDHHATAEELTLHLHEVLPPAAAPQSSQRSAWERAWKVLLQPPGDERDGEALRNTFIRWLCGDLIRSQTWAWFGPDSTTITDANLADALKTKRARHASAGEIIADAARRLYQELLKSASCCGVLRAAEDDPERLLSKNGPARVLGVCDRRSDSVFLHNRRPDTAIAIFNSPFGPDVLVVTDKFSEGIDLHRSCRHLVHYELDPSPIRAVQRNGRIRRVNSWAALTGQTIRYAYPEFGGTRDAQLVKIVKKRIDHFSILLGGVQDFRVETPGSEEETRRNDVIAKATERLRKSGNLLRAREPGAG